MTQLVQQARRGKNLEIPVHVPSKLKAINSIQPFNLFSRQEICSNANNVGFTIHHLDDVNSTFLFIVLS
jgi:hypothetical protein